MIGKQFATALLSVACLTAAHSDHQSLATHEALAEKAAEKTSWDQSVKVHYNQFHRNPEILKTADVALPTSSVAQTEESAVANALKHIQEVRQAATAPVERIVCSYKFNGDSNNASVTKLVVTQLGSEPETVCVTTYGANGNRIESKEVPTNI